MKKLTVGLALILCNYAPTSLATLSIPSFCGGYTFGIMGLFWKFSSSQFDYALTFPHVDKNLLPIFDNGTLHSVAGDYDWAFKANVGYLFPCTANDINIGYTYVDADDHDGTRRVPVTLSSLSHF